MIEVAGARLAVEAIRNGKIKVPYRCAHCRSPNIHIDEAKDAVLDEDGKPANVHCLPCGRKTPIRVARKLRVRELRAVIGGETDDA